MLLGGLAFSLAFVLLFDAWGYFQPPLAAGRTALGLAMMALAATLVEAVPLADIDNLTITLAALAVGLIWF
jgi:hypothetical protein